MGFLLALAGILATLTAAKLGYASQQSANQTNTENTRLTNQNNIDLANMQNEANIAQWQRETEYNTPANQMARLRAAGLNPSLMYGSGSGIQNEAASSPLLTSAAGMMQTPQIGAFTDFSALGNMVQQAQLTQAQTRLLDAQANKTDKEATYQSYLNQVEAELQRVPVGTVRVSGNGDDEQYEVKYGNARVEMTKRQLRALGLSTQGLQYQLNDLYYNLAVLTGSDAFPNSDAGEAVASSAPNYESAVAALRGDNKVRELSGELAQIGKDAAEAEKAGRQAYAKWLEDHKDDPVVKFALTLQGFFQTLGLNMPSVSHSKTSSVYGQNYRTSSSWYFGN